MNGLQLAGIFLVVIFIIALAGIGIYNIRKGVQVLPNAQALGQEPVWHKQPNILLGLSNICFAVLVALATLLSISTSSTGRGVMIVLTVVVFLLSVLLVARTAQSALNAVKKLREKQANKRS